MSSTGCREISPTRNFAAHSRRRFWEKGRRPAANLSVLSLVLPCLRRAACPFSTGASLSASFPAGLLPILPQLIVCGTRQANPHFAVAQRLSAQRQAESGFGACLFFTSIWLLVAPHGRRRADRGRLDLVRGPWSRGQHGEWTFDVAPGGPKPPWNRARVAMWTRSSGAPGAWFCY
ncbi:hypothetical protein BS78_04G043300 [Paspalum vaginatum]|nr:hypothetical protein BS78_04G043300 [Paspalum vaginatum]